MCQDEWVEMLFLLTIDQFTESTTVRGGEGLLVNSSPILGRHLVLLRIECLAPAHGANPFLIRALGTVVSILRELALADAAFPF